MADLREAVIAKHGSIHAFCKRNPDLTRSTVYQVLGDRYPGNTERQAAVIRAALDGVAMPEPSRVPAAEALHDVLMDAKCGRCRRLDRRGCRGCRLQAMREADAVRQFLLQGR